MSAWPENKSPETTNTEAVEIVCIIDRSGSMDSCKDDAIGGFNKFLSDQKALPGNANLTLAMFNDEYELVHDRVPLADVEPLTDKTYVPSGWTALLDAIGKTLDGKAYGDKGIVIIITDGAENHSSEYKKDRIKEIIEATEEKGWEVHYLGAHADAFAEAGAYGIAIHHTQAFAPDSAGISASYFMSSKATADYRSRTTKDTSTDDTDDEK